MSIYSAILAYPAHGGHMFSATVVDVSIDMASGIGYVDEQIFIHDEYKRAHDFSLRCLAI